VAKTAELLATTLDSSISKSLSPRGLSVASVGLDLFIPFKLEFE
jgi:hypothetical protein